MSGPIVYVDHSVIAEGRLDELSGRLTGLIELIESNEPRLLAYSVYLNRNRTEITVVHVHRDVASMVTHFQVAGPAFRAFVDLVRLQSVDVYGDVPDEVVEQLQAKARLLGNAIVSVHPFHAGFVRLESGSGIHRRS
ncbi:MAG TPA: hypothetical protein VFO73_13745 [Candidatus Limnocylindrales bacterium]|nr:hypothetical protein [Candidatus Limnocylindrales bacterium]